MKDLLEQKYQEQMNDLKLDHSDRVWERLEARLNQDQGKVRAATFRTWMMVAASVAVLAISYAVFHSHQQDLILEDIDAMPQATFTAHKYVEECHLIYAGQQWKTIDPELEAAHTGSIRANPELISSFN